MTLYLASTSRYRQELLERLRIRFLVEAPGVDEQALADETAAESALRLAEQKARAVGARHPGTLVLGSDQVAALKDRRFGKPGTVNVAVEQLQASSGRTLEFVTAVCLFDGRTGRVRSHLDSTFVSFRALTLEEIERYVTADSPLDCAGSFRSESLGTSLVDSMRSDDPTALVGLPLIGTARLLREAGLFIP